MWLFSEKLGKISTIAKGAKKNKSKFLSTTLPFCFGEFIVYKGKSLYTINECEIIDSFQDLLNDLYNLTYGSYLCELIDICLQDQESNRGLFRDFITAFYLMKSNVVDVEILARAFEVKILKATGYTLNLENCCICKKKIKSSNYINFQFLGGVCDECRKINGMEVSYTCYNVLKYFNKFSFKNVYKVSLTKEVKEELYNILFTFISQNYFKKPKSLEALKYIKGSEYNE